MNNLIKYVLLMWVVASIFVWINASHMVSRVVAKNVSNQAYIDSIIRGTNRSK